MAISAENLIESLIPFAEPFKCFIEKCAWNEFRFKVRPREYLYLYRLVCQQTPEQKLGNLYS